MPLKRRILICVLCFWTIAAVIGMPQRVCAAPKQAELITLKQQQDLVVMFTFDKEIVDILFISPSGERLSSTDENVETAQGELWSTYRISNAQSGTWSVEYDLKENSSIEYSIIEENAGLWIQYFTVSDIVNGTATVHFDADYEPEQINYSYEIFAVDETGAEQPQLIASGWTASGVDKEVDISLSSLSSGKYRFRLEVFHNAEDVELFDSSITDPYELQNTNEPEAIENFRVNVDTHNHTCKVDWSKFAAWNYEEYRLVVSGDEPVYDGKLDRSIKSSNVILPSDAKSLSISLYYKRNGVWSSPLTKEINLEEEYLRLATEEITGSRQFILEYSVKADRSLYIDVNNEDAEYFLSETGFLSIDLEQGSNTIYAECEGDNLIYYVIYAEIYFDAYPPEIILYDELDGKNFDADSIDVIGGIKGGDRLLANGEEVSLNEANEFVLPFDLEFGENVLTLEAFDANGNSSIRTLTLYRLSKIKAIADPTGGWKQFIPLFASLLASLLIIVLALFFLKKREKKGARLLPWILADICMGLAEIGCVYVFITRYLFCESLEYLEMAEKSIQEAVQYLKVRNVSGVASIVVFVILIIMIVITILVGRKRKKVVDENCHPGI